MSDFNPERTLILTQIKTIHGFRPHPGSKLVIVEEPKASGEVTEAMARRLHKSGIAVYEEDYRPTPVETVEQEAARLVAGEVASPDSSESAIDGDQIEVQDDLQTTNAELRRIAEEEGVALESDDNKADMQFKIMRARAARAPEADAAPDLNPTGD